MVWDSLVLDSSAIVCIFMKEPGYQPLVEKIAAAKIILAASPTLLETTMVLTSRLGPDGGALLSDFLANIEADVIPFSQNHLKVAIDAFLRYGRGRNPAALNFGDCLSYAIASVANMPLLFIGNDFSKTDILQ